MQALIFVEMFRWDRPISQRSWFVRPTCLQSATLFGLPQMAGTNWTVQVHMDRLASHVPRLFT